MTIEQRKRALQRRRKRRRHKQLIVKCRILFTAAAVTIIAIIAAIVGLVAITSAGETKEGKRATVAAAGSSEAETEAATETETETETGATLIESLDWDFEDSYRLAKIAMAEAESEDTKGKALVILTVLNRVWSPQFPDTIEGVITQAGAFTSYNDGRYDRVEPDKDCWAALYLVQMEHWDESEGALYFEVTPDPGESTWHSRNLQALFIHGRHTFYREVDTDADGA